MSPSTERRPVRTLWSPEPHPRTHRCVGRAVQAAETRVSSGATPTSPGHPDARDGRRDDGRRRRGLHLRAARDRRGLLCRTERRERHGRRARRRGSIPVCRRGSIAGRSARGGAALRLRSNTRWSCALLGRRRARSVWSGRLVEHAAARPDPGGRGRRRPGSRRPNGVRDRGRTGVRK